MIRTSTERAVGSKALALGLLLAALMAASLMLTVKPAHADETFTVNLAGDQPDGNVSDGLCDTDGSASSGLQCTLRAAIQQANASPGADAINFAIPGAGVKSISPRSELPAITGAVTIDGYSQRPCSSNRAPCSSPNTQALRTSDASLLIQLDGKLTGTGTDGLVIKGSGVVVRGLAINNFRDSGVRIDGSGADRNKLEGNFIGTDPSGTQDVGNANDGVSLGGGAGVGGGSFNRIGGPDPAARNVISGNQNFGVRLFSGAFPASNNKVEGNLIGTSKDGASDLGNGKEGVSMGTFASANTVSGNTIAFNGVAGVTLSKFNGKGDLRGNRIEANSMFSNEGVGIDLGKDGKTANDNGPPPDADEGPNDLQNFPVLNSVTSSGRLTTVEGELESTPNESFTIEFFSNPRGEDEGAKFMGQRAVTTDNAGKANFEFVTSLQVGPFVTATATNIVTGDTSEFSEAVTGNSPPPANTAPAITRLGPAPDSKTKDATPLIKAKVTDKETDLSRSDLELSLDGKEVTGFSYSSTTDKLSFTSKRLKPGSHTVKVVATDAEGESTTRTWSFEVVKR